jgi:hypothetical protein
MDLMDLLTQQLGGDAVRQISNRLGADEDATNKAIGGAIPVLVGALAKNASRPEGAGALANALDRDHDGGILNDLSGYLGRTQGRTGGAILGHVLGDRQRGAEMGVSKMSGLDPAMVGQLLKMLAPIVMGALGQQKRQSGLSPTDLGAVLGGQRQRAEQSMGGAGGLLGALLDRDGDGSALDDVAGMLGDLLGGGRR